MVASCVDVHEKNELKWDPVMKKLAASAALFALLSTAACTVDSVSSDQSFDTEVCPACAASDFHLQVTADPGLGARMTVIYQSTKDSFGCTDLEWDMLSPKRVPEQYRQDLVPAQTTEGADGERIYDFAFQQDGGDDCASQIRHIYLEPSDRSETADPWASLSFTDNEEYQNEVQVVTCSDSNGLIMCGNDLLYHATDGRARVHLAWE